MALTDLANGARTVDRRHMWPWAAAVVGVVLVVIAVTAATDLRAPSSDLFLTIIVPGREDRTPVQVAETCATSGSETWTPIGTVPSSGAALCSVQISHAASTAIFVPGSNIEFTE
jgi:hypothetical protein